MIQSMIRYLRGYVKIRVQGYSPERFLNLCRHHQIYIWGLVPCNNAYEMYLSLSGFRKLKPIIRKTHTKIVLVQRKGFPFFLHRYRKRHLFFVSFFLCIVLLFFYSSFIWDINFDGNEKWTDQTLLEFLETKEVFPHMSKDKVDCSKIVKDIRAQYNDIVWVSASIDGSRLHIQIKENEENIEETTPLQEEQSQNPTDLVAAKDGVITNIITRSGVPMVHPGDTVAKGDLLVSGRVEIKNDAGEVVEYQYVESDADILADTQLQYEDSMNRSYKKKYYQKQEKNSVYLKLGDWYISVGMQKHNYKEWEQHTSERQFKLGESLYLPISYGSRTIKSYVSKEKIYSEKALQQQLSSNFKQFSKDLQEKGIQIKQNSVKIQIDSKTASAKGTLLLNEKIANESPTEKIEVERKEQDESVGTNN